MGSPQILVNPVITAHSSATWGVRRAPESPGRVRRFTSVEFVYESLDSSQRSLRASGELGELLQHEIDHLDGILAVDWITSVDTCACVQSSSGGTK
jgi:peptide deformylase